MNEPVNPYESPHCESKAGVPERILPRSRFWYLLGSLALLFGSAWFQTWLSSIGWLPSEPPRGRFIEISSLGGMAFLVATWSLFLGWLFLALGWRTVTIAAGLVGLVSWGLFPALYNSDYYSLPHHWTSLVAISLLTIGGFRIPRKTVVGPDDVGHESQEDSQRTD